MRVDAFGLRRSLSDIFIKRGLIPVIILAIASMLCSCSSSMLMAERPRDEAFRTELKKETSVINIPVEASTGDIAKVLNQAILSELYRGSANSMGLTAVLVRNGDIAVAASGNYIYITLPLRMTLGYRFWEAPAIPFKLKFRVYASITPDWRLHTEIYYLGLSDLFSDELKIGPFSFKPRQIVEEITQPVQKIVSDRIAQKINDILPLRNHVADVWNTAHKPVLLDKGYNAWLKLTPTEAMLYPLYAQADTVRLSVGISTMAELVIGPEPVYNLPLALPGLKHVNSFDKTFRIALHTDLYYKDLREIAARVLLNRPIDSDGKTIIIRDMELYGNGNKLVVKLQTEGALDGIFYLAAKPVFNPETGIFSLEDVDFDVQSRSLLLKSGDWLLHGVLKGMIQEKLNMNLTEQFDKSRHIAAKALSRVQLMDNVYLKSDIKSLKFNDMLVHKDRVSIQVYTEGESAVLFQ